MAPKSKTMAAIHIKTQRIDIEDISTAEDSGWRELASPHVADLRAAILAGDFGNSTLAKPSVLMDSAEKARLNFRGVQFRLLFEGMGPWDHHHWMRLIHERDAKQMSPASVARVDVCSASLLVPIAIHII